MDREEADRREEIRIRIPTPAYRAKNSPQLWKLRSEAGRGRKNLKLLTPKRDAKISSGKNLFSALLFFFHLFTVFLSLSFSFYVFLFSHTAHPVARTIPKIFFVHVHVLMNTTTSEVSTEPYSIIFYLTLSLSLCLFNSFLRFLYNTDTCTYIAHCNYLWQSTFFIDIFSGSLFHFIPPLMIFHNHLLKTVIRSYSKLLTNRTIIII